MMIKNELYQTESFKQAESFAKKATDEGKRVVIDSVSHFDAYTLNTDPQETIKREFVTYRVIELMSVI